MTPRQVSLHYEAAIKRMQREHNNLAWLAYNIVALGRIPHNKPMPDLRRLQYHEKPAQPKTPEQLIAVAMQWDAVVNARARYGSR